MTAQVAADLQPGDVVELRHPGWQGAVVTGPVYLGGNGPWVASHQLVGGPWASLLQVTVVSRAPRPLYVNHPRTEPVQHDVVRDGEGAIRHCDAKGFGGKPTWWGFGNVAGCKWTHTTFPPQPLTLLVDGETGRVVP